MKVTDSKLRPVKFRLFIKFTLIISLFLIVIIMIASSVAIKLQREALLDEKRKSTGEMISFISKISAFNIEKFAFYALEEHARRLQRNPENDSEVLSLRILDTEGNKLNPNGIEPTEILLPKNLWMPLTADCISETSGKKVGSVEMIISLESIHENINEMRDNITFLGLMALLLVNSVLALLLWYVITRNITKLSNYAESIAQGNFEFEKATFSNDEIGYLAQTFETMANDLKSSFCELTEQKQQIEKYNKNLELMVEERTRENIQLEKMASLGGLVSGMAHEMNTPLGISLTSATLIEEHVQNIRAQINSNSVKKSKIKETLEKIEQGLKLTINNLVRTSRLIEQFKEVAVTQSGAEIRKVNLSQYVRDSALAMKSEFPEFKFSLEFQAPDSIEIMTTPSAISQIIHNLVANSIIHGFDQKNSGTIGITLADEGEAVRLVYTDDGIGIPNSSIEKIFEPFYTTKRNKGGTGLGLHVTYNIITQRLCGKVSVESQIGTGTTFTIQFPKHPNTKEF